MNTPAVTPVMEKTQWHPVASITDVTDAPVGVRLLDEDLVLWRDAQGSVKAFIDRCPHRGAKFSLGRVNEGNLECPYHGWQFASSGQCVKVPAVPGFTPPPQHCVKSFGVQEAYGLIWVQMEAADVPLPVFEAEFDERLRKVNCGPYDVQASAARTVENFLDMSHFGFVHDGWLGSRDATEIEAYQVEMTATGVKATNCKALQPQSNIHSTKPAQVEYTYEVTGPFTAVLSKIPEAGTTKDGYRESVAAFVCPVSPGVCRAWFRMAVADFDSPDAKLQDFQHTIFMQDKPVLESQQPKELPLDPRAELHCAADRMSSAYRRYLKNSGVTFGVC